MLNAQGLYVEAYVCYHRRMTCEGLYEAATPSTSTTGSAVAVKRRSQPSRSSRDKLRRAPAFEVGLAIWVRAGLFDYPTRAGMRSCTSTTSTMTSNKVAKTTSVAGHGRVRWKWRWK